MTTEFEPDFLKNLPSDIIHNIQLVIVVVFGIILGFILGTLW